MTADDSTVPRRRDLPSSMRQAIYQAGAELGKFEPKEVGFVTIHIGVDRVFVETSRKLTALDRYSTKQ